MEGLCLPLLNCIVQRLIHDQQKLGIKYNRQFSIETLLEHQYEVYKNCMPEDIPRSASYSTALPASLSGAYNPQRPASLAANGPVGGVC